MTLYELKKAEAEEFKQFGEYLLEKFNGHEPKNKPSQKSSDLLCSLCGRATINNEQLCKILKGFTGKNWNFEIRDNSESEQLIIFTDNKELTLINMQYKYETFSINQEDIKITLENLNWFDIYTQSFEDKIGRYFYMPHGTTEEEVYLVGENKVVFEALDTIAKNIDVDKLLPPKNTETNLTNQ